MFKFQFNGQLFSWVWYKVSKKGTYVLYVSDKVGNTKTVNFKIK